MEIFTLVLTLIELLAVIVLVVMTARQRRALSKHVDKLKKTLQALKEDLEGKIAKAGNEDKFARFKEEVAETIESQRRFMNERIKANQTKYENYVQKISELIERLGESRFRIAREMKRFARILGAALRGEEESLERLTESEKIETGDAETGERGLEERGKESEQES